jgi:zinc and cadmium transporter
VFSASWKTWLYALVGVTIVNSISLIGVLFLSVSPKTLERRLHVLVSFAVGALFGDAFIHLLPEAFASSPKPLPVSLLALLGMLLFLLTERFIIWRHGDHGHGHGHGHHVYGDGGDREAGRRMNPLVILNLFGDGVHNLIDGLLIGASFSVSFALGVSTSVAVVLHEIPQEIGDFGILVHGGLSFKRALGFNFLSSLTATLGVVVSLLAGPELSGYSEAMVPVTAGGFIYIAGSNLIPDLRKQTGLKELALDVAAMLAGVGIMALLTRLK